MAISFLFFGPIPLILMEVNVSIIQGMLALFEFGYAFLLSSSFARIRLASIELGHKDSTDTNMVITSEFASLNKQLINIVHLYMRTKITDMDTRYIYIYILTLGIWTLSFCLGNFVGSTVSGFLVDSYGFEWTTFVCFAMYCILLVVDTWELFFSVKKRIARLPYKYLSTSCYKDVHTATD